MKVLALIYPGMTLLDLVGPMQAWSFLPDYEVQYAWHQSGPVPTDCGLSVQATNTFDDAWTDPDVLFVGGGAKPTLDLLNDSKAISFLADRGSRARWVCSVCTGSLLLGRPACCEAIALPRTGEHGKRSANSARSPATSAYASTAIGLPALASHRVSTSVSRWRGSGLARGWVASSN
jgi:hypothetical protein